MSAENQENRLKAIRSALHRGDKARIAQRTGTSRQWVYLVINGQGVSERILTIAEQVIAEREKEN